MNYFELISDFVSLLALTVLLFKIWKIKSCRGISGNSQILFAIVYTARALYLLDIKKEQFHLYFYNAIVKILLIMMAYLICFFIYKKFKSTSENDILRNDFFILAAVFFTNCFKDTYELTEFWRTFSIHLEMMAIVPQICLTVHAREIEKNVMRYIYILTFGAIFNAHYWGYYYIQSGVFDIHLVTNVFQILIYCDIFMHKSCNNLRVYTEAIQVKDVDIEKNKLLKINQNEQCNILKSKLRNVNCEMLLTVDEFEKRKPNIMPHQLSNTIEELDLRDFWVWTIGCDYTTNSSDFTVKTS